MTYIPDGAQRDYHQGESEQFFAWGWLDSDHDFPTGWDDPERKRRFAKAVEDLEIVDRYRGFHSDEELGLTLGAAKSNGSRKFEDNGTIYTAPAAVTFYIRELDYRPPDEVINALL